MTADPVAPGSAAGSARGGWVVLEHGGRLWGVAGPAVERLERRAADLRLTVTGGVLAVDRVLAVVPELAVVPPPAALSRYWGEAAAGLAVYAGRPLLVIDAERPPRALLAAAAEDRGAGD